MKKYMTIGVFTGLAITIERLGRIPEARSNWDSSELGCWIGAVIAWVINAVTWPLAIVAELVDVIMG